MSTSSDEAHVPTTADGVEDTGGRSKDSSSKHYLTVLGIFDADSHDSKPHRARLDFTDRIFASITPPFPSPETCRRVQDGFAEHRWAFSAIYSRATRSENRMKALRSTVEPLLQDALKQLGIEECTIVHRVGYRTRQGVCNAQTTGSAVSLALLDTSTEAPLGPLGSGSIQPRSFLQDHERGATLRLLCHGPYVSDRLITVAVYPETVHDTLNPDRNRSSVIVALPAAVNDPVLLDNLFPSVLKLSSDGTMGTGRTTRIPASLEPWADSTRARGILLRILNRNPRLPQSLEAISVTYAGHVALHQYSDGTRELELYPLLKRDTGKAWPLEPTVSIVIKPGADHFMLNEDEDYMLPLSRLSSVFQDHPLLADRYREQSGIYKIFQESGEDDTGGGEGESTVDETRKRAMGAEDIGESRASRRTGVRQARHGEYSGTRPRAFMPTGAGETIASSDQLKSVAHTE